MKKFMLLLLLSVLSLNNLLSQTQSNQDYYDHLYYTCKVWGYAKYFHSEIAKTGGNWDEHLLTAISSLKNNVSNTEEFNNVLSELLKKAGTMEQGIGTLPVKSEELTYNLNTNWFEDSTLSSENTNILKDIQLKFRPQENHYVRSGISPKFTTDNSYYTKFPDTLPPEDIRLLGLFRYWNLINYYFPYKNIMDKNWDETLKTFIPQFVNCKSRDDYFLSFEKIVAKIDDSHGIIFPSLNNNNLSFNYFLPLTIAYIEDNYVITGVFDNRPQIKIGDIILEINGVDVKDFEDTINQRKAASNESIQKRNTCEQIVQGQEGTVKLKILNTDGITEQSIERNLSFTDYYGTVRFNKVGYYDNNAWEKININNLTYGLVDLGLLLNDDVATMFDDLWDTDALIFDIRNYPNGTMWTMISWLFDSPVTNSSLQMFDLYYPGTYNWEDNTIGTGDFSKTWDKPIAILFNEQTQSQAEFSVMTFELHPKAVKIGSQTAGADGNITNGYLPGGLKTIFTGMGVFYPDRTTPTQRIGIVPDYEVKPTIQGIKNGQDDVLEFAYNYLHQEITNIKTVNIDIPESFSLSAYPNPFNPKTTIKFDLPYNENVKIEILNSIGEKISTLIDEKKEAGSYKVNFNAAKFSSGIYICRLSTTNKTISKKLLLIK